MRHTRYLDAISASGIVTHLGMFKPKDIRYHSWRLAAPPEGGFAPRATHRSASIVTLPTVRALC